MLAGTYLVERNDGRSCHMKSRNRVTEKREEY